MLYRTISSSLLFILCFSALPICFAQEQSGILSNRQRDDAREILRTIVDAVKKNYYDPKLHGIDLNAREKEAERRIAESKSFGEAFAAIAWTLEPLNDSHTIFIPPSRPYEVENGWEAEFVGDKCFIDAVKPDSDAAKKGVKPGDQVLSMEGVAPTRQNFWTLKYIFNTLAPRSGMKLALISQGTQPRTIQVMSQVKRLNRELDLTGGRGGTDIWDLIRRQENYDRAEKWRWAEDEKAGVLALKIPSFSATYADVDDAIARARKYKNLIVDLRGNPGGFEDLLTRLLGGVFEHDVKIGDVVSRKDRKPLIAKGRGDHAFAGNLIVLVDSRSASAAELFARTVQIEKRGLVVGDRSSGMVMRARLFPQKLGMDIITPYAVEITVADLVMTDGKSLEHNGVVPDEVVLPSPQDLAAGRDPQLSLAFQLVGDQVTPEQAGQMFPVQWRMR